MRSVRQLARFLALAPLHPRFLLAFFGLCRVLGLLPKASATRTPPRRVLVVNLTAFLGDIVMMLPFLDHALDIFPKDSVEVVTTEAMAPLLRSIPAIRAVHGLPTESLRLPVLEIYCRLFRMAAFLQQHIVGEPIDLCLMPRWGTDPGLSAYFAAMTGAAVRMGHNPEDDTEGQQMPGSKRLLTHSSSGGYGLPESMRELRLLSECGLTPMLDLEAESKRTVRLLTDIVRAADPEPTATPDLTKTRNYVVISPGASRGTKRWSPAGFAHVARLLGRELDAAIVIVGTASDGEAALLIQTEAENVINLTGQTSLASLLSLISRALLVVTNDSGPAHVSAGLGIPTLILFPNPATYMSEHSDSPQRVRPAGPRWRAMQPASATAPCVDRCESPVAHCILAISAEEVITEALALLGCQKTSALDAADCS